MTNAKVKEILTDRGRARGVTLEDGRTFTAPEVVAATDPITLVNKLLDPEVVPERTKDEVRGSAEPALEHLHIED